MIRRARGLLLRFAGLFRTERREREWRAELESHLQMHIDDNLRRGMTAGEARQAALVRLGGLAPVTESMREQATLVWVETIGQDLRYAWRSLRRSPAFAVTVLLSLALGLGASLAVFTLADNLLIRPLPFPDASRLVMVWDANPKRGIDRNVTSPANYFDWKTRTDVFQDLAGAQQSRSVLSDGERAEELGRQGVTANFFQVLGVHPYRGRLFTAQEDRAANSAQTMVIISYRLWQSWFGGEESVLGRKVQVNAVPRTIIAVMPPGFYFRDRDVDLWEPLGLNPAEDYRKTQGRWMMCVGRLRPRVTLGQAQAQMVALAERLELSYPVFNKGWTVAIESVRDSMFGPLKTALLVLLGAVGLLLAVACANVANLLLARYASRRREMAVRVSLGAGRGRVIRQLLTESILLGLAGGAAGLALARWAVKGLLALAPSDLTRSAEVHFDFRIAACALALSAITGILFGLAPALIAARADLQRSLREDTRAGAASGRLRAWLVGAEVALSVVLLAGALLLFRSLAGLLAIGPGLDPANLLTFRVSIPAARYQKTPLRIRFYERAVEEIGRLPGVVSAGAVSFLPFGGPGAGTWVRIAGRPDPKPGEELVALIRTVTPGYFHAVGIPLKRGRDFSAADNQESAPYRFVVNEAFVRQNLRGEEPIGKQINALMADKNPFGEIVGVVGDAREWAIDREPMPTVYYVYAHLPYASMFVVVRAQANPLALAEPARRIIRGLDPGQPVAQVRTLTEVLAENLSRQKLSTVLLSTFSLTALLLAAIGIYGVLAYSVAERTREIGVRAALGADAGRIIRVVIGTAVRPVVGGMLAGMAGALALTGLLKSLLFGVGPRDPLTFGLVPAVLAAVALIAAWVPAARAARLNPVDALRAE